MEEIGPVQKEFRDIHKGKLAFLIGAGPSFADVDTTLLDPYITMVVGPAIFAYQKPTYFFSCDGTFYSHKLYKIIPKETKTIHGGNIEGKTGWMNFKDLYVFYADRKYDSPEPERNTMRNSDEKLIFGLSSAHPAAHLLHIMGCDPIVLLGCECRYSKGVQGVWMLPQYRDRLTPEIVEDYGGGNFMEAHIANKARSSGYDGGSDGYLSGFANLWNKIHSYAPNVSIVDSCNSVMTCFPKMSIEGVIENYGDRK